MVKKKDENEIAFSGLRELINRDRKRDGLQEESIPEPEGLSYRVKAGRKGGLASAKSRMIKLSKKKRSEIASKAAKIRWSKNKPA